MKRKIVTGLIFSIAIVNTCFSQVNSLPVKHYIKLGLPFWYKGFLSEWYTVGLQYERLLSAKNSISFGISYYNSDRKRSTTSGIIQHYKQVMILPQWRHYLRKKEVNYFNGFYLGASAVYLRDYIDRIENRENRYVMGLGVLLGYQQVIEKSFLLASRQLYILGLRIQI